MGTKQSCPLLPRCQEATSKIVAAEESWIKRWLTSEHSSRRMPGRPVAWMQRTYTERMRWNNRKRLLVACSLVNWHFVPPTLHGASHVLSELPPNLQTPDFLIRPFYNAHITRGTCASAPCKLASRVVGMTMETYRATAMGKYLGGQVKGGG